MPELHPLSASAVPPSLKGVVFPKAVGFVVGAAGNGLAAGMFLPWLRGEDPGIAQLQLTIPVISGAMVGGGFAGGAVGRVGWSLVAGTFGGAALALAGGAPAGAWTLIPGALAGGLV